MNNKVFRLAGVYIKEERKIDKDCVLLVTSDRLDDDEDKFHLEIEYDIVEGTISASQCYEHQVLPYTLRKRDKVRLLEYMHRNWHNPNFADKKLFLESLYEADNLLYQGNSLLKRIYKILKFDGFCSDSLPKLSFKFREIPHRCTRVDIYLETEFFTGITSKMSIQEAGEIMESKGVIVPSDFEK